MRLRLAHLAIAMIFVRKHRVGYSHCTLRIRRMMYGTGEKGRRFFLFFFEGDYYSMLQRGISTAHHLAVLENTGATCEGFKVATDNSNQQEKRLLTFPRKSVFKDYVHPLLPEAASLPVVTLTAYQDMKIPCVQNIIHFQSEPTPHFCSAVAVTRQKCFLPRNSS